MKKIIAICLITALILSGFSTMSVSAANADFTVIDGILYDYTGTDKTVTVPYGVYRIADGAFSGNTDIRSVNLSSVSTVGNRAFYDCENLETVSGASVTSVGAYAFENTKYLSSKTDNVILGSVLIKGNSSGAYTAPASLTAIAPYAFIGNEKLTSVTVTAGISQIGEGAFYGCSNLGTVSVSSRVSYIGAFAFEGTKWLSSQTGEFITLGDGILIKYNGTKTAVTIPETVKRIGEGAFYNNLKVTSVTIPETVTSIGMRAFYGAKKLASVKFPASLVYVGKEAFAKAESLTALTVPGTVEYVGESAFLGCTSLESAEFFSSCNVPAGAFAGCTSLKAVRISSKTEAIGEYAFLNCNSLTEISIPDSAKAIDAKAFSNADKVVVYANEDTLVYNRLELMGITVSPIGDANCDGRVDVKDATFIQKSITKTVTLNFSNKLRGDADFNGEINVKDGTSIQKTLAGIK